MSKEHLASPKYRYGRTRAEYLALKTSLLMEADGKCTYCGEDLSASNTQIDHITPQSLGGDHEYENLVVCCQSCNAGKNSYSLLQWKDRLRGSVITALNQARERVSFISDRYGVNDDEAAAIYQKIAEVESLAAKMAIRFYCE